MNGSRSMNARLTQLDESMHTTAHTVPKAVHDSPRVHDY